MGLIQKLLHRAWEWNNHPRAMTPLALVALLRRMQADKATPGEWDYFQSLALADPRLEPIRKMVAPLYGPGFDPAADAVLAEAIVQSEQIVRADEGQKGNGS
ncbi:hypothetical protein [Sphingomonas sp. GB1N7]|uniref:hypothetical protein n=1 Tax=Parasphingomonas caseinilytica TaxID=3096158 RepID=UPI002FC5D48D